MTRLTQVRAGIRSSTLREQSNIRDAAAYANLSKIRWAGHVMRLNDHRWTRAVSDSCPTVVVRQGSTERQEHNRKTIDSMVRLLHEVVQGNI
ncbi:hypothetical protein ANCDUO_10219 [Ancylostoma duodenale]|uniref:Uncharacterized protein n=1 Tax=Ancylostoma duodenale TaxID=51022 RepID=A0A0C2CRT4_9BILA|nr:hypothetical protein ANCDUO_10219 [Ancylostoma duodenale]